MSVNLQKKTSSDAIVKLVSVQDDAIDWEKSLPYLELPKLEPEKNLDEKKLEEFEVWKRAQNEALKKAEYLKNRNTNALVFKPGENISVFCFKHVKRVDVQSKLRSYAAQGQMALQQGQELNLDALLEIFHIAFIGVAEGFEKQPQEVSRIKGRVTIDVLQAFEDAGILIELSQALYEISAEPLDPKKSKS